MEIRDLGAASAAAGRPFNEDAVLALKDEALFAVADGTGGSGAGDVCADAALNRLRAEAIGLKAIARRVADNEIGANLEMSRQIEFIVENIHERVRETGQTQGATTLVTATLTGANAFIAHVGNSRAYIYRHGSLRLLTDDHTAAMLHFRRGRLSESEMRTSPLRHKLYQILGAGPQPDVDVAEVPLADDDILLLTSDGVHSWLTERQMAGLLSLPLHEAADALVQAATEAGSDDNASAVAIRVGVQRTPKTCDQIAYALNEVFLFNSLSSAERALIAPYMTEQVLAPGQRLFAEGEEGDAFYVLVSGSARISKGDAHLVDVGPGGFFGELCLARPVARSATVTARDESVVFGLHREQFHEILARRPALGARLAMALLDNTGGRLREMTDRVHAVEQVAAGDLIVPGQKPMQSVLEAARGKLRALKR